MKRSFSRRNFLLGSSALSLAAPMLGYSAVQAQGSQFPNELSIPPQTAGRTIDGTKHFDLRLQSGTKEFFTGIATQTRGINGNYLGPVLRLRSGENVRMNVENALPSASTLHWHGFNLPAVADGGPHQEIKPGNTWSPEFEIRESASTLWYHSHQLHETASQVWSGLAGLVIIDDAESDALNLPSRYGVDDIPVVLQDRVFNRDGTMPYRRSMHNEMVGMIGDIPVINGTVRPFFEVSTSKLRMRLLNGANASIYALEFADKRKFFQIASDGGLLESPISLSRLTLAPGERAEIVVEFQPGETTILRSVGSRNSGGMGMGMGGGMDSQTPRFEMIEFRAGSRLEDSASLPDALTFLPQVLERDAVRIRKILLEMPGMNPLRMLGLGGGFTINGNTMDLDRIDAKVRVGETEIWEISNAGPMIHPFHVHNTQFRILDRDGAPPPLQEAGRKDTVVVHPGERVRILVKFEHYSDRNHPYMYHCHILEHEDAGMMGQFVVI